MWPCLYLCSEIFLLIAQSVGHIVHNEALPTHTDQVEQVIYNRFHHPPFFLFPYPGGRRWKYKSRFNTRQDTQQVVGNLWCETRKWVSISKNTRRDFSLLSSFPSFLTISLYPPPAPFLYHFCLSLPSFFPCSPSTFCLLLPTSPHLLAGLHGGSDHSLDSGADCPSSDLMLC